MPLRFWNRNYVGTHFGGSLYAMCDPFFMIILMNTLGPGYIVWDKAATIRFKKPGKGLMKASFHIPAERVAEIRALADSQGKTEPTFSVSVTDVEGNLIAAGDKLLYVRQKETSKAWDRSICNSGRPLVRPMVRRCGSGTAPPLADT